VLRADVYRPDDDDGRYPVILSYGPYAKGLAFQEGYPNQSERMFSEHPDVAAGSSNRYQRLSASKAVAPSSTSLRASLRSLIARSWRWRRLSPQAVLAIVASPTAPEDSNRNDRNRIRHRRDILQPTLVRSPSAVFLSLLDRHPTARPLRLRTAPGC
jgi:hypothetical protein